MNDDMKKLGFGLMRLPLTNLSDTTSIDLETTKRMVDMFIERGFSYFDTAYPYHGGHSEVALRKCVVERYPRERFTVTSKLPCWSITNEDDMERIFNEQLERTGLDYLDYYWLHALNHDYVRIMDRFDGWGFIARKKAEGKIRHIGFSFHSDSALLEKILQDHPEMEFVQLQINYLDWESTTVEAHTCYDLCVKYGKPVIVMEPVKGGSLAKVPEMVEQLFRDYNPEASAASWAIRYAASLPNVMMVLSGMSDMAQMDDNTSVLQNLKPLNADEQLIVEQAANIINDTIAIPCTACRYCVDGCPQNISIPEYFEVYNTLRRFGKKEQWTIMSTYYNALAQSHGKPSDCLQCGQCEEHCPQQIPIIKNLHLVTETFEH